MPQGFANHAVPLVLKIGILALIVLHSLNHTNLLAQRRTKIAVIRFRPPVQSSLDQLGLPINIGGCVCAVFARDDFVQDIHNFTRPSIRDQLSSVGRVARK